MEGMNYWEKLRANCSVLRLVMFPRKKSSRESRDAKRACMMGTECYKMGDYENALMYLHRAAIGGNAMAICGVGMIYIKGLGVEQDGKKALYWFLKGAKLKDSQSQYMVGMIYYDGIGVKQNLKRAARWLHKSALQGFPMAQFKLGYMYEKGIGFKQNFSVAACYYHLAAPYNMAALFRLGNICHRGLGMDEPNYKSAIECFNLGVKEGNAACQCSLGEMYADGCGVEKDVVKAVHLFHLAAEQGVERAQFKLAYHYKNGIGVEKDDEKAAFWNEKAEASKKREYKTIDY